jgi:hypothetical protein
MNKETSSRISHIAGVIMAAKADGNETPLHKEMLGRQLIAMSEYLVVLDERLTDLGIAARSAPVEEIPIGEDDGA